MIRLAAVFSLATIALANGGLVRATPPETKAPDSPATGDPTKPKWSVVGEWQVTHPNWQGTLAIRPDGTFARAHGDGGKWTLTADGDHLVLQLIWNSWVTETAAMITPDRFVGRVRKGEFELRRGEEQAPAEPASTLQPPPAKEFDDPAAKARLSDSTWQLEDGKHFTLHADGSTTADWHDRKGSWRTVGPNRVQLAILWRERPMATVTVERDGTLLRWSDEDWGKLAKRVEAKPKEP